MTTTCCNPRPNRFFYRAVSPRWSVTRMTPAPRPGEHDATYDPAGNMSTGFEGSGYVHDAQNRLTQATTNGVTINFKYDGFNRQVRRSVTGQPDTFSVWDGWDLIQEYQAANNGAATAAYLYGATGLIVDSHVENSGFNYYYQDASGSTSHVADATGHLLEWYRYDLDGTPFFYNANDSQLSASNYSVRHLFTGQQWYQELGLYDLRNRFYSPDIGRFLQPDPIGFRGDGSNLYRYCRNNPVTRWDPFGLQGDPHQIADFPRVYVPGDYPPIAFINVGLPSFGSPSGGPGEFGLGGHFEGDRFVNDFNPFPRPREDNQPSVQHSLPSSVPAQNPPLPVTNTALPGDSLSAQAPAVGVFVVVGSEFAGGSDYPLRSAYGPYDAQGRGPVINPSQLGASLPFRFPSNNAPPGIGVGIMNLQTGLSASASIVDVGPWSVRDNYWDTGGVPLAVSQFAAHAVGQNGQVVTNPAGIDLTPGTMDAIGARGPINSRQVEVMWWFLTNH